MLQDSISNLHKHLYHFLYLLHAISIQMVLYFYIFILPKNLSESQNAKSSFGYLIGADYGANQLDGI